jgi:hypothetical protein
LLILVIALCLVIVLALDVSLLHGLSYLSSSFFPFVYAWLQPTREQPYHTTMFITQYRIVPETRRVVTDPPMIPVLTVVVVLDRQQYDSH